MFGRNRKAWVGAFLPVLFAFLGSQYGIDPNVWIAATGAATGGAVWAVPND